MNTEAIARPYAKAAFEFALAQKALASWDKMLDTASRVTQDATMQQLLTGSQLTSEQQGELFSDVLDKKLDTEEKKNFIRLLAEKRRLSVLPEIAGLFKSYREAQEKKLTVKVISASTLDDKHQTKITDALTKRLSREIFLECETDEKLIGGAVIIAGDLVIDGSVRGKLNRLNEFISGR